MKRLGLAAIVALLTCAAPAEAQTPIRTSVYASGFTSPVAFVQSPTDRDVQFVVEQGGRIRTVQNGVVLPTDFLDLRTQVNSVGERGLLGMAMAPDYFSSGRFYVNFTDVAGNTVVARFRRSAGNPLIAELLSRWDLRWGGASGPPVIAQPYANHNGGHLAFGPDGFLYIGLGDGGSGNDPAHRAQNPSELLGKMLRIDVNVPDSDPSGYKVPASNPFVGMTNTLPEIWAFGLRNPWRYSFDDPTRGGTGALVIGDVGQNLWEEIDYEPPNRGGRNYGWRNREGAHDNVTAVPPGFLPHVDPIHEYSHSVGQTVTGGYVYRGRALGSAYRGRYFFADFVQQRVWSLALTINPTSGEAQASNVVDHTNDLGGSAQIGNVSSFAVGWDAELYAVSYSLGAVLKIVPAAIVPASESDFDADKEADVSVFRPSSGTWYIRQSATPTSATVVWGGAGDRPVARDFDGDGKIDVAVFRPSNGTWYIRHSATPTSTTVIWGGGGDVPVAGDYDTDGKADVAVFRPSTSTWHIRYSGTPTSAAIVWGGAGDVPVVGDYDADGKADIAVLRPSTGTWYIRYSGPPTSVAIVWGGGSDVPAAADYDGDVKADIAVFRAATGTWYIRHSATPTSAALVWGGGGDVAVPGDYDGDGRADIAVFRPSNGSWYIRHSATPTSATLVWGGAGDVPILTRP